MADVARRVVRLLERAQHERRERRAVAPTCVAACGSTSSPACWGVRWSGAGGVGTSSDSSWASSRSTRGGSGGSCTRNSAGSLRASSSPATASLAAIIRNSISRCDSVCSDGSRLSTWPSRENAELGLGGLDGERSRASRASASAAATLRAAASGSPTGRPLAAGEHAVDLRVVEPRVGADHRAVERGPPHLRARRTPSRPSRPAGPGAGPASTPGSRAPRAASAPPARARRPSSRAGTPRGRARARACTNADTSAMCTHTRIAPSASSSAEIASSKSLRRRRVDRERRQVAQVRRRPRSDAAVRASRSTSGSKRRRSPRCAISASSTSRATSGRPIRRTIRARPPRARRDLHEVADALAARAACRR